MLLRQPSDHLVAGADRQALTGQHPADHEQDDQRDARQDDPGRLGAIRERLRVADQPGEDAGADRAADTDQDRSREVAVLERRHAVGLEREDGVGAAERDEDEISRCAGHQRRQEHAPGHLVAERHLEREDGARRRRLEDRRDAGRGAGDQQRSVIDAAEGLGHTTLDHRPQGRAAVERRPLQAHRAARAQCGDRSRHATDERTGSQGVLGVVEGPEILVRRRGRRTVADGPQQDRRQDEADTGRHRRHPQRAVRDPFEDDLDDHVLEEPDEQPGDRTGDRSEQHDLAGASHQVTEFFGADVEGGWAPSHRHLAGPHDGSV
jgi:hypothetical protein